MENQKLKKVIIGQVTISKYDRYRSMRGYMSMSLRAILKSDRIVFNIKEFTLKFPHIDTKKSCSIKGGYFSFMTLDDEFESIVGRYKVFKKDEDTFVLKKMKHEQVL